MTLQELRSTARERIVCSCATSAGLVSARLASAEVIWKNDLNCGALAFHPDGSTVAAVVHALGRHETSTHVQLMDAGTGKTINDITIPIDELEGVYSMCFNHGG